MSGDIFEVELHHAVAKNDKILKDIRQRLEKHQHGFVMTREELTDIEIQLATMAYLAAQAQKAQRAAEESFVKEMLIIPPKGATGKSWLRER